MAGRPPAFARIVNEQSRVPDSTPSVRRRSAQPKKRRRDPARSPAAPRTQRRAKRRSRAWWLALVPLAGVLTVAALLLWARRPGPGTGQLVRLELPDSSAETAGRVLRERGLVDSAWLFSMYAWWRQLRVDFEPGEHLLLDTLSPKDLVGQLARLRSRASQRVTLLEGWTHQDIGKRLESSGICSSTAFRAAFEDAALLERLSVPGETAEGYLFPDTYELHRNSDAETVVVTLVQAAKKQLAKLREQYPEAYERMTESHGFSELHWVTLASILEKEAVDAAELPAIASVFFNRLTDPTFRPARMLQSDPTAAYGCRLEPERAPSCKRFQGRIVPEMLRDSSNRYNTYRHPGLPPGPISNPGKAALLAVLMPDETDYLFFFADGKGRHTFSRTFDAHRAVIRGQRAGASGGR